VEGRDIWVGNAALARAHGFAGLGDGMLSHHQAEGRTTLVATIDGQPGAVLAAADVPKAAAADAIQEIRALGARTLLISGDTRRTVEAIAKTLGIDEVRAEVWPEAKAQMVAELQQRGHRVAMVGDGVNDAPALARADLGIAIGSGTGVVSRYRRVELAAPAYRIPRQVTLPRLLVLLAFLGAACGASGPDLSSASRFPATATPASSPAASAAGSPATSPDAGAVKLV